MAHEHLRCIGSTVQQLHLMLEDVCLRWLQMRSPPRLQNLGFRHYQTGWMQHHHFCTHTHIQDISYIARVTSKPCS